MVIDMIKTQVSCDEKYKYAKTKANTNGRTFPCLDG